MDIAIRLTTPEASRDPIDPALFAALDESARALFWGTLRKAARRVLVASAPTAVISHAWHALAAFLAILLLQAAQELARVDPVG